MMSLTKYILSVIIGLVLFSESSNSFDLSEGETAVIRRDYSPPRDYRPIFVSSYLPCRRVRSLFVRQGHSVSIYTPTLFSGITYTIIADGEVGNVAIYLYDGNREYIRAGRRSTKVRPIYSDSFHVKLIPLSNSGYIDLKICY